MRVDLPVTAYVPPDYIAYEASKIDAHRRIARARDLNALGDVTAELSDRFGPPPEPVENLLTLQAIRLKAAELGGLLGRRTAASACSSRASTSTTTGRRACAPPTSASSTSSSGAPLSAHRESSDATAAAVGRGYARCYT